MKEEGNFLDNVSLLLGKFHGGLAIILYSNDAPLVKLKRIQDLEKCIRFEIERLYYPLNPHSQDTNS